MQIVRFILPRICALVAVAWYTLFERKVLGYIINRKGPNKVGILGLIQPLADGVKLFSKEIVIPTFRNNIPFFICPVITFFIALIFWLIYPFSSAEGVFTCGFLFYLANSGVNVYGILVAGWSSNSKYALLGSMRGVAQRVSYEVRMALCLLAVVYVTGVLSLQSMSLWQISPVFWVGLIIPSLLRVWLISILAETNRAPFDFVEGESELVSGFNVEYGSVGFALLYIAEYANMLFNSLFTCVIFFGAQDVILRLEAAFFFFFFIWVRGRLPRFRYDILIRFVWKRVLILVLSVLIIVICSVMVLA